MILDTAKAWIALLGAIVTSLLASGIIPVTGAWQLWLTVASITCTAVTTYEVPNRDSDDQKRVLH